MTFSKERYEYHLTPRGWEKGSFKGDILGGERKVETPPDRVLTIWCYDELTSAFSKPDLYDRVAWKCDDEDLITQLKKKYGERPDWFGYKK